ncbi:hypothetical protein VTG60DRAFT_6054 [Thermothelomyces hinnuleus]
MAAETLGRKLRDSGDVQRRLLLTGKAPDDSPLLGPFFHLRLSFCAVRRPWHCEVRIQAADGTAADNAEAKTLGSSQAQPQDASQYPPSRAHPKHKGSAQGGLDLPKWAESGTREVVARPELRRCPAGCGVRGVLFGRLHPHEKGGGGGGGAKCSEEAREAEPRRSLSDGARLGVYKGRRPTWPCPLSSPLVSNKANKNKPPSSILQKATRSQTVHQ